MINFKGKDANEGVLFFFLTSPIRLEQIKIKKTSMRNKRRKL